MRGGQVEIRLGPWQFWNRVNSRLDYRATLFEALRVQTLGLVQAWHHRAAVIQVFCGNWRPGHGVNFLLWPICHLLKQPIKFMYWNKNLINKFTCNLFAKASCTVSGKMSLLRATSFQSSMFLWRAALPSEWYDKTCFANTHCLSRINPYRRRSWVIAFWQKISGF